MNVLLKLEETAFFLFSLWMYHLTDSSWLLFAGLFFLPDLGMLGYLKDAKTGAWLYNIFHHKGLALALYGLGLLLPNDNLELSGIILFAHASFDRMLGYGLKLEQGFQFTHLGTIGKPEKA